MIVKTSYIKQLEREYGHLKASIESSKTAHFTQLPPSMVSSEQLHVSPSLNKAVFDVGKLEPLSYTPVAISTAILAYLGGPLSSKQQKAKERFDFEGFWNLGNPENLQDLKRLFQLYDSAYFNDLLGDFCHIEIVEGSWAKMRIGRRPSTPSGTCEIIRPGEELDPRWRTRKPYVRIKIIQDETNGNIYQRIQRYQTALLHRMLHTMFLLYTCVRERGCAQKVRDNSAEGAHHIPWQAASQAIEKVDRHGGPMFGFGTDLSRNKSMALDMMQGYNLPGDAALRSVGLDIVEILKHRDEFRKAATEEKRLRRGIPASWRRASCLRYQWTVDNWEKYSGYDRV